ncbi:proteasomal ATPase-associated factor 1-like [Schistocerca gregaria]|uniref:proteasomal ATPase-associated factor 1-like n=1 Tax=Schistocerca gregaria TaxID=7010 RepID=UPI00211E6FF4|nr:proteasomal ATPase-associated factor 1-like [Schistocerca gregaria]
MNSPFIRVQHDWYKTKSGEKFWVNVITEDGSVYGSATVLGDQILSTPEAMRCAEVGGDGGLRSLKVSYKTTHSALEWTVLSPSRRLRNMENRRMHFVDVSSDGSLRIQSHDDGYVGVFREKEQRAIRELTGAHAGTVYVSKFFPSGKVALTAGMDTKIRIWDLVNFDDEQDKECAATLCKQHTQAILSVDILGKGRRIASGSRDGTAIVWDIPTQKSAVRLEPDAGAVNWVSWLSSNPNSHSDSAIIALSCESQSVCLFDVNGGKKKIVSMRTDDAANVCTGLDDHLLAVGTHSGQVLTWDLRHLDSPISTFRASKGPVTAVSPCSDQKLAVATHDAVSVHSPTASPSTFATLLSCSQYPTYTVSTHQNVIYTGGLDGVLYVFVY